MFHLDEPFIEVMRTYDMWTVTADRVQKGRIQVYDEWFRGSNSMLWFHTRTSLQIDQAVESWLWLERLRSGSRSRSGTKPNRERGGSLSNARSCVVWSGHEKEHLSS